MPRYPEPNQSIILYILVGRGQMAGVETGSPPLLSASRSIGSVGPNHRNAGIQLLLFVPSRRITSILRYFARKRRARE